jgi:hypothetical protein
VENCIVTKPHWTSAVERRLTFKCSLRFLHNFGFTCYNPIQKSVNTSKTTREEIAASRKTPKNTT